MKPTTNSLVAWILAATSAMAVQSARFSAASRGTAMRRVRQQGPRQPAGNKLARKAAERRLGLPSGRRGLLVDN